MKLKILLTCSLLAWAASSYTQSSKQPALISLKDGGSVDAIHFGQLKCGKDVYGDNYIILRGMYMDSPTEIKEYKDIEKIIPEGYTEGPATSVGNEKITLRIIKKNGVTVTLTDAELVMSCYGSGDRFNELVVQIMNPLTNQAAEQAIETRNIQSIIFK